MDSKPLNAFYTFWIGAPGIKKAAFENLASDGGLGRNKARDFINDALLAGKIRREGKGNRQGHFLVVEPPAGK
jgi:hypothetical protein